MHARKYPLQWLSVHHLSCHLVVVPRIHGRCSFVSLRLALFFLWVAWIAIMGMGVSSNPLSGGGRVSMGDAGRKVLRWGLAKVH